MGCGCWRDPTATTDLCDHAVLNGGKICPESQREATIRQSIWKCLEHCEVKKYTDNQYKELYKNIEAEMLEKIRREVGE